MIKVQITDDGTHSDSMHFGNYDYTVQVGKGKPVSGRVENQPRKHFSFLLMAIAEDSRIREFVNIVGEEEAARLQVECGKQKSGEPNAEG